MKAVSVLWRVWIKTETLDNFIPLC